METNKKLQSLWKPCYSLSFEGRELFHTSVRARFEDIFRKLLLTNIFLCSELHVNEYQMIGSRNNVSCDFLDKLEDHLTLENDPQKKEKILDVLNHFYEYQERLYNRLSIEERKRLENEAEYSFRDRMVD